MQIISFFLTQSQVRARTKTVTRRLNWPRAKAGMLLRGVVKSQGRRAGEPLVDLATIRLLDVRREPLQRMIDDLEYGAAECAREGFPEMTPSQFVAMFCERNKCEPTREVARLLFEYTDPPKKENRMPILRRLKMTLPVRLTETEYNQRSDELATRLQEHDDVTSEKKKTAKSFDVKLEEIGTRIHDLARQVRDKAEDREVDVEEVLVHDDRTVRIYRTDTGEEVRSRPATDQELTAGPTLFDRGVSRSPSAPDADDEDGTPEGPVGPEHEQ